MRVLAIVPSFNEERALPGVLAELSALGIDALVIDDGSTDRTSEVARSNGARVVRLCTNLGIGGAVQTGLRAAFEEKYDCAVQVDGDGQHDPSQVPALLARISEADLIVGSRFLEGSGFQSTPMRRAGKGWLGLVLRVFAGVRVTDPTSGFRAFGPRAIALFQRTFPYDYPEPESLSIARAAGLRVLEVPVRMRERQGGSSSIRGLVPGWYMLKVTAAVILDLFRARRELPWKSDAIGSLPSSASPSRPASSASSRGST